MIYKRGFLKSKIRLLPSKSVGKSFKILHFFIFAYITAVLIDLQKKRMKRIFRNGRWVRILLDANKDGASGWESGDDGQKSDTDSSDTSKDDTGKKDEGKDSSIPKARFDEVNERMKKAEAELAKRDAEKKQQEEEEAKKRGEHEKLLAQRDEEIAEFKKQQELRNEREEILSNRNNERIETLKKDLGDGRKDAESLISDIKDPFKLSSKLDSLEKIYSSKKTTSKSSGGSDMPSGWKNEGKLAELQKRANDGEHLTIWEQAELLRLARWKRDEK